ncbi:SGNH/GDSL hydrolase family protein [Actinosynnema sp. ALI-1.44]|uniref:SGNH/GDSL hydrolase family protein n=1 Tax=Actinosynnema sp. ALI-1.44 TaxID=1933779 RepID=UPI00192D16BB|nr:SGNH/GDSL hydrolase family protein [Actinosynnema sp. ALI-1.44]
MAVLGCSVALAASGLAVGAPAGADPAARADFQWVALGDSYTAGVVGAAGNTYEVPRDGCQRTDQSYPVIIERDLGSLFDAVNVSCGGATIEDVTVKAQEPFGYHLPVFGIEDPDYPFPAVAPQDDVVRDDTDVITVGVGGNTLGFGEILGQCALTGNGQGTPCKDKFAGDIQARLDTVEQQYTRMLAALHERASKAKILTIGYPAVIPADTTKCEYDNTEHFGKITRSDLDWLRQNVLEALNERIKKSTGTQQAATFVDLYESSKDHSVCDDENKWVEGLTRRGSDELALVHPNAAGQRHAADRVEAAMLDAVFTR